MVGVASWVEVFGGSDGAVLVWAGFIISLLVVGGSYLTLNEPPPLKGELGAVGWSFTDSWASTVTEVGALLGVIIAEKVVADEATPLSATAIGGLSLLFGALAVISPLIFSAIARTAPSTSDPVGPMYKGFVGIFLVSSTITVWAVLGQLGTLSVLLAELAEGTLSSSLTWLFLAFVLIAIVSVGIYAIRTTRAVLTYKVKKVGADGLAIQQTAGRWHLL